MNQVCSCGAFPPEDALFCHRCGRPLRELIAPEAPEEPALVPEPPLPAAKQNTTAPLTLTPISLRNPSAVRVGLGAAAVVILLQMVPLPALLQPVWVLGLLVAGGFLSVYVYYRKTGDSLSIKGGARLGWMTGLFVFLITLIFFSFSLLLVASESGVNEYFRQLVARQQSADAVSQLDAILSSSGGSAVLIVAMVVLLFVFFTVVSSLGGALAAKVLEKD